jgi:hypothetical protein
MFGGATPQKAKHGGLIKIKIMNKNSKIQE